MAKSTSMSQSHSSCSGHSLRPNLELNASRESKPATEHRKTNHPRRKWKAVQHEKIQKEKKLRLQNWAKRCERLNKLSALNSKILKALDIKECLLEIQITLIEKLAVKENHIKKLVKTLNSSEISFDEMMKNVEDAIRALQYWEQSTFSLLQRKKKSEKRSESRYLFHFVNSSEDRNKVIKSCYHYVSNCACNALIFSDFTVSFQSLRNFWIIISISEHCAARSQSLHAIILNESLQE